MIKALFWAAIGAAGALQGERWFGGLRKRFSPHAVTDALLDKVNAKLENGRYGGSGSGL